MYSYFVKLTEKGQITIPIDIRQRFGLRPGDEIEIVVDDGVICLRRAENQPSRGQRIVDRLIGRGDGTMTTDEIMALTRGE